LSHKPEIFLTVDILLFRQVNETKELLLIQRLKDPFKDSWALPGGFVDKGEDLEDAAKRELEEETSIKTDALRQFKAYGKPDRDPRGHTVSVVFYGTIDKDVVATAQDDAKSVQWFSINDLPPLAFDHAQIIAEMVKK
jgi:8-oxo-dGTP diphosphatase